MKPPVEVCASWRRKEAQYLLHELITTWITFWKCLLQSFAPFMTDLLVFNYIFIYSIPVAKSWILYAWRTIWYFDVCTQSRAIKSKIINVSVILLDICWVIHWRFAIHHFDSRHLTAQQISKLILVDLTSYLCLVTTAPSFRSETLLTLIWFLGNQFFLHQDTTECLPVCAWLTSLSHMLRRRRLESGTLIILCHREQGSDRNPELLDSDRQLRTKNKVNCKLGPSFLSGRWQNDSSRAKGSWKPSIRAVWQSQLKMSTGPAGFKSGLESCLELKWQSCYKKGLKLGPPTTPAAQLLWLQLWLLCHPAAAGLMADSRTRSDALGLRIPHRVEDWPLSTQQYQHQQRPEASVTPTH